MDIRQTDFESSESRALLRLLNSEWSDLDGYEKVRDGLAIPKPLVALESDGVIGGAAFTAYLEPNGVELAIWLNALYVVPEYRGRGVASSLIKAATEVSPTLYALTDVPGLYTKLGWRVQSVSRHGSVVCMRAGSGPAKDA